MKECCIFSFKVNDIIDNMLISLDISETLNMLEFAILDIKMEDKSKYFIEDGNLCEYKEDGYEHEYSHIVRSLDSDTLNAYESINNLRSYISKRTGKVEYNE